MKKLVSLTLALLLCVGMLAGCSGSNNNGGDAAGDGIIKLAVSSDITSLDPQNHNDTVSAYMTRHIYSNLITIDENNNFVGDLAESWAYVDGSDTQIAFKLKEGVKFHDGSTLTSEDVKFTLERCKTSTKVPHLVAMIDNVEVVDETNFIINLLYPSNTIISSLFHSGAGILSKAYTEALEAEGKTLLDQPMGTGQYKFVSWTPGTSVVLEKFDEYFDETRADQNNGLEMKVYLEDAARTIALETGEVDLCLKVPTTDANRIKDNAELALNEVSATHIEYFGFNTQKAPFDNKLVRQAMNYVVNKSDVVIAATEGVAAPFDSYISSAAIGYYDTAVKYEQDLEKAKDLLNQAGYNESNPLTFTAILSGDARSKSATVIQAALKSIGVEMKIESMESSTFYEICGAGDQQAFFSGWVANAEPDNTYRALWTNEGGNNYSHYNNDTVNGLVNVAATSIDKAEVENAYKTVLATISDDAVWCPLYQMPSMLAYRAGLQGVHNSAIGMHNLYALHY
jgi:peptide/nickel transport system substrate-binding protein